ncbi:MAG: acyl-CoA dehydratase activase [Pseudomonadota bacterium]
MSSTEVFVAGTDAGTECIKVLVLSSAGTPVGQAVVPTRGYFQDCIQEAMGNALREAKIGVSDLRASCVTGFGATCAPMASEALSEVRCHARSAMRHRAGPLTLIDIGGRDPQVIRIDEQGRVLSSRSVRKCAVGIGTFLMFAARHLDVHPTRLMDLATSASKPVTIGSYCSVFGEVDVIEQLRNGATVDEIALGCMHSVAERIMEIGALEPPIVATGGVCEYFTGVMGALAQRCGYDVAVLPEPIMSGALGAALIGLDLVQSAA